MQRGKKSKKVTTTYAKQHSKYQQKTFAKAASDAFTAAKAACSAS